MAAILLRSCFVMLLLGLALQNAAAQKAAPTPFTGIPTVPKTIGLFGHASADGLVLAAASNGDADGVASMLAAGGNPDDADGQGRTALMHAAMTNTVAVANVLLAHGALADARDKLGDTALHWAAQTGSLDIIRLLIALHAPVDTADAHGLTPLMLAASNNRPAAVRLLLESHANPHKTDYTGRDALGWGAGYPRIVSLMQTLMAAR